MFLLISILIGAICGWVASLILQSKAGGILYNMLLGIIGGFVAHWLRVLLELSLDSWKTTIIAAATGSIVVIIAGRMMLPSKKRKHRSRK